MKLGVKHSTSTIRKYMVDLPGAPNSTLSTFLSSHADQLFTVDFTTHYLWNFSVVYLSVVMELGTRKIVQCGVTSSPTLDWVKQQIREATPWARAPRFLTHDNDGIFGQFGRLRTTIVGGHKKSFRCTLDAWLYQVMGIQGIPIPYGAPNAQAHIERFMGTLKRECLRHFIYFSERQLRRSILEFVKYYNEVRPHQGIHEIPEPDISRQIPPPELVKKGRLVSQPILGGVHHDYRLAA